MLIKCVWNKYHFMSSHLLHWRQAIPKSPSLSKENALTAEIARLNKEIKQLCSDLSLTKQQILAEKRKIKSTIQRVDLTKLTVGKEFDRKKRRYLYIKDNIATLKSKKQGYGHPSGMFQKVRPMLANLPTAMDIRKNERQLENVLDDMVEAVISSNSPFCRIERETIQDLNKLQSRLSRTRREKHRKNSAKNRNLRLVRDECHELRQDLKAMEKANYGLEHLNPSVIHSWMGKWTQWALRTNVFGSIGKRACTRKHWIAQWKRRKVKTTCRRCCSEPRKRSDRPVLSQQSVLASSSMIMSW